MRNKIYIFALITVLSIASVNAFANSPILPEKNMNYKIEVLIETLRAKIVPPKGIPKSEIDKIFGEPEEIKKLKGKDSNIMYPMRTYQLLPPKENQDFRAFLYVTYKEKKVHFVDINYICVVKNYDLQPATQELARENRKILIDLLEIYNEFHEKLETASWNKK